MPPNSASIRDFPLPDLGEGLTEGEIASWLVDVGDTVEVDQPVAEVETAKAVVEIPSPFAGVVTTRHAEVGQDVQVGQPLISIDTAPTGDGSASDRAQVDDFHQGEDADEDGDSGNVLVGYGTGARARSRRRRGAATAPPGRASHGGQGDGGGEGDGRPGGRHGPPLAKPPVRKMAKDLGIDLADVTPTGDGGVITREDVRAAADGAQQEAPSWGGRQPDEEAQRIPLKGVRKVIAEKMTISRSEIPEATSWVDCDATALMATRNELNDLQADVRVSPLALVMRACVAGLRRFPHLNASLDTTTSEIVLHRSIHLGFAAHTDRGLVVPVIFDADKKSTLDIAVALGDLGARARDGNLAPNEMTGSTFSVSNYGSFGVDGGAPVINHPEAAILGVGRISPRPWVHDGEIQVRQVMQLSIAFDHRICDGGEAAGLLRFVADCVERPSLLLASL